jgi:hypothetical protein
LYVSRVSILYFTWNVRPSIPTLSPNHVSVAFRNANNDKKANTFTAMAPIILMLEDAPFDAASIILCSGLKEYYINYLHCKEIFSVL